MSVGGGRSAGKSRSPRARDSGPMALGVGLTKRLGGPASGGAQHFMHQASRSKRDKVFDRERHYKSTTRNMGKLGPGPAIYSRINPLPRDKAGTGRDGPTIFKSPRKLMGIKDDGIKTPIQHVSIDALNKLTTRRSSAVHIPQSR